MSEILTLLFVFKTPFVSENRMHKSSNFRHLLLYNNPYIPVELLVFLHLVTMGFLLYRIYHPNVDEKGQVCLPIVAVENWKPATKMEQVAKFYYL